MKKRMRRVGGPIALAAVCTMLLALVTVGSALAYERYNDGCQQCHGDFTGGMSPKGTVFPGNDKHKMHRDSGYMATNCNLCHKSGDGRNPFLGVSDGTANNPGVGCTGCHGRDYGGQIGNSGTGLRGHHAAHGVSSCAACHWDDPAPLPEDVKPTYYGTADTRVDDPCNTAPDYRENWSIGDTEGLDNDGDDVYDEADSDCAACAGDLDGDGDTDQSDLGILLGDWGCTGGNCAGDLDGDGDTDQSDLGILLADWACTP